MMESKKIITIFGATGAQGGGLARAILNDANSEFGVRAVTRDPDSEKAKELQRMGAELVVVDLDNGYEQIERALQGAYGAFFVTFFWHHFSPEKEINEAQLMARAAKAANLKHVIWSTLEDVRKQVPLSDDRMPTLMEKYKVPHFDGKGKADQYFENIGVPTTYLRASFYWENFIYFGMGPKKGIDGKIQLTLPLSNKRMAGVAAEDIGKCAYGIFKEGLSTIGKVIGVAGEHLSGDELAFEFSRALNIPVEYNEISPATYRDFGFPGADDLGNMFQYYAEFEKSLNEVRDVSVSKSLNASLKSFSTWLSENVEKISVE